MDLDVSVLTDACESSGDLGQPEDDARCDRAVRRSGGQRLASDVAGDDSG